MYSLSNIFIKEKQCNHKKYIKDHALLASSVPPLLGHGKNVHYLVGTWYHVPTTKISDGNIQKI